MKINFKWKGNTAQYQTGESLYLNKIRVASYEWNSSRSKSDSKRSNADDYVGQTLLPQANRNTYGETPQMVKTKIEHIVTSWFEEALA